jgi:heme exporter protein D
MQWTSLESFLALGGYGAYVWGAYGVSLALLLAECAALALAARRAPGDEA